MVKRNILNFVAIALVTVGLYFVHSLIIDSLSLPFSLTAIYVFHGVAYFSICLLIELVAYKMPAQAGYAYLATVFVKIGVFVLVFRESIMSVSEMTMKSKLSLVVPMLLYLVLEAVYCGRLLNSKSS